ncbi:MAG: M12 family metallopeptidase [Vicinamibacteria bacterium]
MIRKYGYAVVLSLAAAAPARAGILSGSPTNAGIGVHSSIIDVCFVGDAVTSQPAHVKFIREHLALLENYGHFRYRLMGTDGKCPAPTQTADGQFDVHQGDLRIGVPGSLDYDGVTPITGDVALGKGCADSGSLPWWANFPVNMNVPKYRACRLNAFLRSPMALNKILHEIGHSLGLVHEHERTDVPLSDTMVKTCYDDVSYFGKGVSQGNGVTLLTPYDKDSVMHYEINNVIDPWNVPANSTCNLGNDNGSTGLSAHDQLSLRILYPHSARAAEYEGTTVVRAGETVRLSNQWGLAGALTANVVKSPKWVVRRDGMVVVSKSTVDFQATLYSAGRYEVTYTFKDMLNRNYTSTFELHVLESSDYAETIAGTAAASAGL